MPAPTALVVLLAALAGPSRAAFFNGELASTADLVANYTVVGENVRVTYADQVLEGHADNTSVVLADHGGAIALLGVQVDKTGSTTDSDAASFVGLNAAVVAQRGGSILIKDSVISSRGNDSNAVHVPLDGHVELLNTSLLCYNTQGHGIDVTGGSVVGHQLYIETHGASASSLSTDEGGGNISVYDSQVVTYGTGSLVAYSTGNIHLYNVRGHANNSHALGMDGRNYISARSCTLSANGAGFYAMQSFEYDMFGVGRLLLEDTTLAASEASFLVTNSQVDAEVRAGSVLTNNGTLAFAYGYAKAVHGKDGGQLKLAVYASDVAGEVRADNISYVGLSLLANSSWAGRINADQGAYWASLTFDNETNNRITLTGDSYLHAINVFSPEYLVNAVTSNGYSIYYSTQGSINTISFAGQAYNFTGGGQLAPWVV